MTYRGGVGRAGEGRPPASMQIGSCGPQLRTCGRRKSDYLALENPGVYFSDHRDDLVILDEVQSAPELFQRLRGVIEQGRRDGKARTDTGSMNSQRQ